MYPTKLHQIQLFQKDYNKNILIQKKFSCNTFFDILFNKKGL